MNEIPLSSMIIGALIMLAIAALFILRERGKNKGTSSFIKSTVSEPLKSDNGDIRIVQGVDAYPAYVLEEENNSLYPCRLNKPLGRQLFMPPPMPETGWHYLVIMQLGGQIVDYEPRLAKLISKVTPDKAWRATRWDEPQEWFVEPSTEWKEASTILTIMFGLASFIFWLVCVGA